MKKKPKIRYNKDKKLWSAYYISEETRKEYITSSHSAIEAIKMWHIKFGKG